MSRPHLGAAALLLGIVLFSGSPASGQPLPQGLTVASPSSVGLSAEAFARATDVLQRHVDDGNVAGVVAAVVRDGKLVYLEALGSRELSGPSPMPTDALFRIYSMTRPVTALAILMLQDDGLLDVHDPVQKYLPQFTSQRVLRSPNATDPDDARARVGDMTLAQLLTHTSGIGSRSSSFYREQEVHRWDHTLEQVVDRAAELPLFDDPGTRFRYGMSAEILGRVVEEVSGLTLSDFYRTRIFEPLGMDDTVFFVDPIRARRLAPVYRPDADGQLGAVEMETIPVTEPRALFSAGVGLVSSTLDMLRFAQLFLDEGMVDGRRLISADAVLLMRENGVPQGVLPLGERGYWAGSGWSLGGMAVVLDPSAYNHTVRKGEFWWDGSAGTRFWIDPGENMITIVMAQVSPAGGNGFREDFKTAVYEALPTR